MQMLASPTTMKRAFLAAVVGVLACAPGLAAAAEDADTMAIINAERAAIGVAPFIGFDTAMADGCRKHSAYTALNADHMAHVHDEISGRPGYTPEGQLAASRSNLGGQWDEANRRNPYAFGAPWHEMGLLSPYAGETFWRGVSSGGIECTGAGGGSAAVVALDQIYVYPASGASNVPYQQSMAGEGPYSPSEFLGLPSDTVTGPNIYLFGALGLGRCLSPVLAASLRDPTGADIPYWQIDRATVGPTGLAPLVRGGMLILPKEPLQPSTAYTFSGAGSRAEATCASGGGTATQFAVGPVSFSTTFITAAAPSSAPAGNGPSGGPESTPGPTGSGPGQPPKRSLNRIELAAGRLVLSELRVEPSKRGSCPKAASVRIKSGTRSATRKVKVGPVTGGCQISATIRLSGRLAKATKVAVTISGKGLITSRKTVRSKSR